MAIVAGIVLLVRPRYSTLNQPIAQCVAERGRPSFLAQSAEVFTRRVKGLYLGIPAVAPQAITNLNGVTNAFLIWAESQGGRRNARYFYEEMKSDKSFDGGGWYSSESSFGERDFIVKPDSAGRVKSSESVRVDAISMKVIGWVPRKIATD